MEKCVFFFFKEEQSLTYERLKAAYMRKFIRADEKNRLEGLELENLRLKKTDGYTINLNQSSALLDKSQGGGGFLSIKCTN